MNSAFPQLHSHSVLERELNLPKHLVLVDEEFAPMFAGEPCMIIRSGKKRYCKVGIMSFVRKGGVFKNFSQ